MDSQEKNIKEKIHDDSKDIHNYLSLNLNHSLNAINPILSQVEKAEVFLYQLMIINTWLNH